MLIGLLFEHANKRKRNLWQPLEPVWKLFSQRSELYTMSRVSQPALAALFVNGLAPEISGWDKRQKIGWEATA